MTRVSSRLLLGCIIIVLSVFGPPSPSFGHSDEEHVRMDQSYNVIARLEKDDMLPPEEREPMKLYLLTVPQGGVGTEVKVFRSRYLLSQVNDAFTGDGGVKFPMVNLSGMPLFELKRETAPIGGALSGDGVVSRLNSHATFYSSKYGFLKLQRIDSRARVTHNGSDESETAVAVSDLLETIFDQPEAELPFIPERFAASLRIGKYKYAFSHRSSMRINSLLPGHGLLGSLEKGRWFTQNFIPEFARFLAKLHFHYGVYPSLHTQNLLVDFDFETMKVRKFAFRDTNDVMLDPFVWIARNSDWESMVSVPMGVSIMNLWHVDNRVVSGGKLLEVQRAGTNLAAYAFQTVGAYIRPGEIAGAEATVFLNVYAKAVEQETGVPVLGVPELREALQFFENPESDESIRLTTRHLMDERAIGSAQGRIVAAAIQAIYDKVVKARLKGMPVPEVRYDQKVLAKLFVEQYALSRVAFPIRGQEKKYHATVKANEGTLHLDRSYKYGWNGKHIVAIEKKSGKVVGYAFGFTPSQTAQIRKANKVPVSEIFEQCQLSLQLSGTPKKSRE